MDSRARKERRHRVDENERARGREHKRHQREEDGTSQHHDEDRKLRSQRPRSPLKVLKSLQQSSTDPGHSAFVQQWLGQVDGGEGKKGPEKMPSSRRDRPHRHKHSIIAELETLHKTTARHDDRHRPSRKDARQRRRHTSSDSSMLQPANDSAHIDTGTVAVAKAVYNRPPPVGEDGQRKRKHASDNEPSSRSELPQANEIFDKRRRHKTKEDRYDAKTKRSKAAVEDTTAKKKTKKVKRGDAAKISRAAGEDLIKSFASNKIAKERLTMRPGAGIFRNGKASSPLKKRGIADLAFSEMGFLSHSKNKAAEVEKEVVTSKHGQKMQRERERARNEISDYFAPRQPPQPIVAPNRHDRRSSLVHSERYATTVASSGFGGTSILQIRSPHGQHTNLREHYLGFGTNISSPRRFSLPPPSHEPIYVRPSGEAERSDSSSSTSYVSWSETEKSPNRLGSPATGLDEREPSTSSSPCMLRMRLIESGILDGLGLSQCQPSKYRPDTRNETLARKERFNQQSLHRRHSAPDTDSSGAGRSFRQREAKYDTNQSNTSDQLRRQQIEAARRAISSPHLLAPENEGKLEAPRSILASRAYLRRRPSSVPRRPATTTPIRQSSQNRVLSRSSLQHEMMQDPGLRNVSAQQSVKLDQNGADPSELGGDYAEYHVDLPSHIRMPSYGSNGNCQQLWTQDQMAELGYDGRVERSPIYEQEDNRQNQQYQCSDYEQEEQAGQHFDQPRYEENAHQEAQIEQPYEQSFAQQYYQESSEHGEGNLADLAIDYSQPLLEPDPMSQYFQTPRGQSYFQLRGLERSDLQPDTHLGGLLEDQMKNFWATKRW